jgi:hypothetical protein
MSPPPPGPDAPAWTPPAGPQGYYPQPGEPGYAPPPKKSRTGAVIVGAIALILIAIVAGFFLFNDRLPGAAAELAAGQCIDLPSDEGSFTDVQRQPCDQAHDAEVFIVLTHPAPPGEAYPVLSGFDDYVEENCVPAFEAYTGRSFPDSELTFGWFSPTLTGWGEGDRGFTCHVARVDRAKMTSSVRAGGAPASP